MLTPRQERLRRQLLERIEQKPEILDQLVERLASEDVIEWNPEKPYNEAATANQAELLGEYARLMNTHGPDSKEAQSFFDCHEHDSDLAELMKTAYWLKKSLNSRKEPHA